MSTTTTTPGHVDNVDDSHATHVIVDDRHITHVIDDDDATLHHPRRRPR
jgi:hypothetical protein